MQPASDRITRKARIWPELPKREVALPQSPNAPAPPNALTLVTLGLSLLGMIVSAVFLIALSPSGSGIYSIGFLGLSGFTAIGSLVSYVAQRRKSVAQRLVLRQRYHDALNALEATIKEMARDETQQRFDHDPPLSNLPATSGPDLAVVLTPLIRRQCDNHNLTFWARQPEDPDFLAMPLGVGAVKPSFAVTNAPPKTIAVDGPFDDLDERARKLALTYHAVHAPVTVPLAEPGSVTIVDSQTGAAAARALARTLVGQVAYHHSPLDVRIVILAPAGQQRAWEWAKFLPHTRVNDIWRAGQRVLRPVAVATDPASVQEHLVWLSRESNRRDLVVGESGDFATLDAPHLLIILDQIDPIGAPAPAGGMATPRGVGESASDLFPDRRARDGLALARSPELALALERGHLIGCSVITLCADRGQAPTATTTLVELTATGRSSPTHVGYARHLAEGATSTTAFTPFEDVTLDQLSRFASAMRTQRPARSRLPTLPTQVDLRQLFTPPLDLATYAPEAFWSAQERPDSIIRANLDPSLAPSMPVPVGERLAGEIQWIDIIKDGPHGLLIGQTGSGKSELLQTLITSLALRYSPEDISFLLIDYKSGLALESYASLPHTVGFLTNVASPGQISRFITMLRAEANRRGQLILEAKRHPERQVVLPRLLIVIDEFAEMAKRSETILDEIFSITKVGRGLGMHLLLSAQRSEGVVSSKVRDYVQYRCCLRVASADESRDIIGRTDAADLPSGIPGRCYLQHGDNQLELFQTARATVRQG